MRIKSRYYEKGVFPKLQEDVEEAVKPFPDFKEELFDKLYTFFHRYFSESGSIYFRYTPLHQNIYEKVYTDDKDVMLFWKTHMLYYVKSDRLFKSLEVEIPPESPLDKGGIKGGYKFFFDVSTLEHKKANEKRETIYELKEVRKDGVIAFNVRYTEKGRTTKLDEIVKTLRKAKVTVDEELLEKAFRVFGKQSEVDYFINKNAKEFLREQFNIWLYQYVFSGESEFSEKRIRQLQALKDIAFKVIDFISQFEDELVRIWNKPKFVLNSNYVITLDRIIKPSPLMGEDKGEGNGTNWKLLERILNHPNFNEQVKEWKELGIVDNDFKKNKIIETDLTGRHLSKKYQHLPLDTKYFKDLELEILGLFDDLDKALDGWLIKSENYQALNTILPKFKERVQTIYIDPPFNKEQDADYFYSVKYKDASWITLLENRLQMARVLIKENGCIFIRCDYNGNLYIKPLMDEIFGKDNYKNEIIVNRFKRQLRELTRFNIATESLFYYGKSPKTLFKSDYRKRVCTFCGQEVEPQWRPMSSPELRFPPERTILGRNLLPPRGRHWTFTQNRIDQLEREGRIRINEAISYVDIRNHKVKGLPEYLQTEETPVDSNWTDLKGYAFGSTFATENAEELLQRTINISSDNRDLCLDFFLGSGTTTVVAHKLGRKWIGIEMGEHFYTVVLPRMKKVLAGDKSGVSKEVNWQGGGFFKYYELEQYEDTLRKVNYEDADLFENPSRDPYNQYIFLKDLKLLEALEIDYKKNKVKVDLNRLYDGIDIPETLSNLLGKWIKKITPDYVEFEDGEKINLKDLDYKLIKPLIWW
jgi:adenine specific DNA methylase Mod